MSLLGRSAAIVLCLIVLWTGGGSVSAQSSTVEFFAETGHHVRDEFLRYYRSAPDPGLVFGYPITEQITSKDGRTVQYFQRARFELRTDLPEDQRVQMTPLGRALYQPAGQLQLNNTAGCEVFVGGYPVCFAFLDFYRAHGGPARFGDPISPFEFHDNLIVQYFEKARFEWRADRPEGQRVVLTDLGRLYFDHLGEDPALLKPVSPVDATINAILSIRARAFVAKPLTRAGGEQTVYVIVQSQTFQPVAGASGRVTVRWPDGQTDEYFLTTNRSGLGTVSFSFADQTAGELVPIDIVVVYEGLGATTKTSFRIWL